MKSGIAVCLLFALHGTRAQMSDVVSCVARAATIERDVRDTCCSQASECRVWGRGEPDACTGDCHAFFVPLYTNCSYMFGQQNMVPIPVMLISYQTVDLVMNGEVLITSSLIKASIITSQTLCLDIVWCVWLRADSRDDSLNKMCV